MIQIHDRAFLARSIALRPSRPGCCAWCLAALVAYPQRLHIWAITLEVGCQAREGQETENPFYCQLFFSVVSRVSSRIFLGMGSWRVARLSHEALS